MKRSIRRVAVTFSAAVVAGTLAMAGTAQAGPAQSASGDVTSGPVHMKFDAMRPADSNSASGFFSGDVRVGMLGLMHAEGPVTCLTVEGNHMGLFYPVTSSSPSLLADSHSGVYMNITTDGNGNAKSVSYSVVPGKTRAGCKPAPTFLPATGRADLTS